MDIMKENTATIVGDRGGLKNHLVTPSFSKRQQHALFDVRNTVHKKHLNERLLSKQLLEVDNAKEQLGTPSPRRKLTSTVEHVEPHMDAHCEDLDDDKLVCCPCNLNDRRFEDYYLPEYYKFTETDVDNLTSIWLGQGGRVVEEKFDFSPIKFERKDIDLDDLIMRPDLIEISLNDSGIDLDIAIETE